LPASCDRIRYTYPVFYFSAVVEKGYRPAKNSRQCAITAACGATESLSALYVVIIDNDTNTYEQVIRICMKALQISEQEAFQIALAVDHNGEAIVFEGIRSEAQAVADVIRTIGIEVQLRPVV